MICTEIKNTQKKKKKLNWFFYSMAATETHTIVNERARTSLRFYSITAEKKSTAKLVVQHTNMRTHTKSYEIQTNVRMQTRSH